MFNLEEVSKDWELKNVSDTSFSDGGKKRTLEIAKSLKENNVEINIIMITTGLSETEIEKL